MGCRGTYPCLAGLRLGSLNLPIGPFPPPFPWGPLLLFPVPIPKWSSPETRATASPSAPDWIRRDSFSLLWCCFPGPCRSPRSPRSSGRRRQKRWSWRAWWCRSYWTPWRESKYVRGPPLSPSLETHHVASLDFMLFLSPTITLGRGVISSSCPQVPRMTLGSWSLSQKSRAGLEVSV